jgi:hypothetical protein
MPNLVDPSRYPELPIALPDTPICLRGANNICKAAGKANLSGLAHITRVVGGGSTHRTLEALLRDHRTQLDLLAATRPELAIVPKHDWIYVPIGRVRDLLKIEDVSDMMPDILQYSGTFEELLPKGYLLAAKVEIIKTKDDSYQHQKHTTLTKFCNSYVERALKRGMPRVLGDIASHQFTYGTTATKPVNERYYYHDIEPRMIKVGF